MKLQTVLASFIKYPRFLYVVDSKLLRAAHAQDEAFGFFLNELIKHFKKNPLEVPNIESLIVSASSSNNEVVYLSFIESVPDFDFIEPQAKEYIRAWIWEAATKVILPNLSNDEGSRYIEVLKASLDSPITTTSMLDIKQDFGKISEIYRQLHPVNEFPIGVPTLDSLLKGGIGRGELAILQAVTNVGKTWYVLNSCLANARKGYNTAFVSLEMIESEIFTRVAMLLLNKSSEEVELKRESTVRELQYFLEHKMKGNFTLIKDSPGGMSVYDIEQRIKQIKLQYNYNLDYLVIDYDDLIKLTGEKEKQYLDLGQLYRDLKSLAQRYNIGVLIASQLNRDAMTNKSSGLRNTSGSIQKVQIADIVIHLEDREAEGLLLRITKSRRGIKNKDVNVVPDFEHGDLLGIPIGSLNSYTMPSFEGLNVKDF